MKNLLFILISLFFLISCNIERIEAKIEEVHEDPIIYNIVTPDKSDEHSELTEKCSDYLVLFYIAADNSNNDFYYEKMIDIVRGIYRVRSNDNITPKKGYAKIQAVVLWDGSNSIQKDSSTNYKYFIPNSKVFEAKFPETGRMSDWYSDYLNGFKDVSSTATFLGQNNEINTGSKEALKNFLTWSKEKYSAEKIILVLCGIGEGPFGTYSRANQMDNSSRKDFLTAPELNSALKDAGYAEEKLDLIIFDSSFSSSLEDLYEIRNCVKSVIASPGETPVTGINYKHLLKLLKENSTIYDIGSSIVNIYASSFYNNSEIDKMQYSTMGRASISFIDESNIEDIATFVDTFAYYIISQKNNNQIAYESSRYSYFQTLQDNPDIPYNFLTTSESLNNFLSENTMSYRCTFKIDYEDSGYSGGHFFTYDLAYLASAINIVSQQAGTIEIQNITNQLIEKLDNTVISSWKNGTDKKEGLYKSDIYKPFVNYATKNLFGLTITGAAKQHYIQNTPIYYQPYQFSDFSFKADSTWYSLLKQLYPNQFED